MQHLINRAERRHGPADARAAVAAAATRAAPERTEPPAPTSPVLNVWNAHDWRTDLLLWAISLAGVGLLYVVCRLLIAVARHGVSS